MIRRAAFWIVGVGGWAFASASLALWIWLLAHRSDNYEADVERTLHSMAEKTRAADERAGETLGELSILRSVIEGHPELEQRVAEKRAAAEAERKRAAERDHVQALSEPPRP